MKYDSYWMNGMGFHSTQLEQLAAILKDGITKVVEFGSGNSTQFLVEDMFKSGEYDEKCFINRQDEIDNFSARNCFYDMTENDLPDDIDLVILDGPNGNGRSISFLHLKNKLSNGAYILIDDSDHYDFIERCKQVLDVDLIVHENNPSIHPLFNYAIMKVKI